MNALRSVYTYIRGNNVIAMLRLLSVSGGDIKMFRVSQITMSMYENECVNGSVSCWQTVLVTCLSMLRLRKDVCTPGWASFEMLTQLAKLCSTIQSVVLTADVF